MVSFRGKKKFGATPRLVSFRGLIQNFRGASPPLSYEKCPPPGISSSKGNSPGSNPLKDFMLTSLDDFIYFITGNLNNLSL